MRCPFFPLIKLFWTQKRIPHFEAYPYHSFYLSVKGCNFEKSLCNDKLLKIHVHIWQAMAAQWAQEQQQPEAGYGVRVCVCVYNMCVKECLFEQIFMNFPFLKRYMNQEIKTSKGATYQTTLFNQLCLPATCRWWMLRLPSPCLLQNRRCLVNQRCRVGLLAWRLMRFLTLWPMMRRRSVLSV